LGHPSNYEFLIAVEDSRRFTFGQVADVFADNFYLEHISSFGGHSIFFKKIPREQKAPIAIHRQIFEKPRRIFKQRNYGY
jgi:hypothetical protein